MVRSSRRELTWLEDDKVDSLNYRESSTAIGLGAISGGGGYLYTGDLARGAAGLGAMAVAIGLATVLPAGLGVLAIAAVSGWGAFGGWRRAKLINQYVASNFNTNVALTSEPGTQNLLSSMAPRVAPRVASGQELVPTMAAPGQHAQLCAQLSKLASIRAAGVISESEHRSRKIDLLAESGAGLDPRETESFLFELLPLLDAGILDEEDLQFAKDLGQ